MSDDTDRQSAEGQEPDSEMRALNERLLIAAIRQQELAETATERAENALKTVALYRLMARNFPSGMVLLFDHDLRHILAEGTGLTSLGLSKEALEGRTIWDEFPPQACQKLEPAYRTALAGETTVSEVRFAPGAPPPDATQRQEPPGAQERVCQVSTLPVRDGEGRILSGMAVVQDVTEQRRAEEVMRRLAHHDALTGLPNRALLRDRLDQALAASARSVKPVALLFLDLDGFKRINDTRGHAAGDQVLTQVALRLTGCLRAEDTVARVGGDEFVVLLPGLQASGDAAAVARKIAAALATPIKIDGSEMYVTASVGVSVFPSDGQDEASLMKNADAAMYRSKLDRLAGQQNVTESG